MSDTDIQRKLIDAINLLAEYADAHLPVGVELSLTFTRGEATLRLEDCGGDEIEVHTPDAGISTFAEACVAAKESGRCIACWNHDAPVDEAGHCADCQSGEAAQQQ